MTEAVKGSEQPGTVDPGNPSPASGEPGKGSPGEPAKSWLDGLSEGNRKLAETKGWKEPGDLDKVFTSYTELEKLQGESLRIPGADAKPEELDKLYTRLGRPEKADQYEFKRPEGLPADLPYNDQFANASKPWLHEAGLSGRQAQIVHDRFATYMGDVAKARATEIAKSVTDTHDALVKEWGPQDSEGFKQKHTLADRAMKKLGLTEAFQGAGIILPDGALTNAQLAKAFSAIGEAMFKEDTIVEGGMQGGENPFKRGADGKIKSPGAISALIKSDPERAKRLAREAGENLTHWFPQNPR